MASGRLGKALRLNGLAGSNPVPSVEPVAVLRRAFWKVKPMAGDGICLENRRALRGLGRSFLSPSAVYGTVVYVVT